VLGTGGCFHTRFSVETEVFRLPERFMPLSYCILRRRFGLFRVVNRTAEAHDRRKLRYLLFLNPYYEAEENAGNVRPSDAARIWFTQEQ
jgi:hypothetical protein